MEMNKNTQPLCCFQILNNDRMLKYLKSIGLWVVPFSDSANHWDLQAETTCFVVAKWFEVDREVNSYSDPVIAIGPDDAELASAAFEQGCFDYARFTTWEELGARLKRLAERFAALPQVKLADWFVANGIEIDHNHRLVKKDGVERQLTKAEFRLLTALRPDLVRTRDQLVELASVHPGTFYMHVHNINRKLDGVVLTGDRTGSKRTYYRLVACEIR